MIRFIGRRNLCIQDQHHGRRHYLSQDQIHWLCIQDQYRGRRHCLNQNQIHWSQEPTYPRSIQQLQTSSQSRSDSLVIGTYLSKINIVVTDITSVKIRFIGDRNLRIQDQYRGRRHYLSQDQVFWSQTLPSSRSSPLVADTTFIKIEVQKPSIVNNSIFKIRMKMSLSHLNYQGSFQSSFATSQVKYCHFLSKGKALVLCSKVLGSRAR